MRVVAMEDNRERPLKPARRVRIDQSRLSAESFFRRPGSDPREMAVAGSHAGGERALLSLGFGSPQRRLPGSEPPNLLRRFSDRLLIRWLGDGPTTRCSAAITVLVRNEVHNFHLLPG